MERSNGFTVFGGHGFIASALRNLLESRGHPVRIVGRDGWPESGSDLGHVVFTIGMTAGFRGRPFATVNGQVTRLAEALEQYRWLSFLYLSSTRVYRGSSATTEETPLIVRPTLPDDIYNLSKLTGENLCLSIPDPSVRVVRLSNVYGSNDKSDLFLTAVVREAVEFGKVTIRTSPDSDKDYIFVEDVAEAIRAISLKGRERLYNVASGTNVTNKEIADVLLRTGLEVNFEPNSPSFTFPQIDVSRLSNEFGFEAKQVSTILPTVIEEFRKRTAAQ